MPSAIYHLKLTERLWSHKALLAGICCIGVLAFATIFSNMISGYDPVAQGDLLTDRYLEPTSEHPFGTDKFGRDLLSRVLYGGRISLTIAFSVVFLTATIGLLYGTLSGYLGGLTDSVMMRFVDFLLAFPSIFIVITVVAIFEMNHWLLIPILSLTSWMETARIVRTEVLTLKERDFISAAKGLGYTPVRILFEHIIPNSMTPVIVAATLKVGEVILLESALSFLGLGVQSPTPSWGNIINDGREVLMTAWWVSTFPGLFIAMSVMSFNLIGDGLRQALSPSR